MKIVTILNTVALLLIFAPFFQMCSDDQNPPTDTRLSADTTFTDSTRLGSVLQPILPERAEEVTPAIEEKSRLETIWNGITFPGNDATAFGMLVSTLFSMSDGDFAVGLLAILNMFSVVFTTTTLVLLLRSNYPKVLGLFITNLICLLGAYITAHVEIEYNHPVKWGFYAYFITLVAAAAWMFISRKKEARNLI